MAIHDHVFVADIENIEHIYQAEIPYYRRGMQFKIKEISWICRFSVSQSAQRRVIKLRKINPSSPERGVAMSHGLASRQGWRNI
jgi:hypothetical protein